jgi:tripartite-type tricarboxylate transporter receptor subunit TctC
MTARLRHPSLKCIALSVLLIFSAGLPAMAQWPTKTVRIVVPFGPGSTPDIVARVVADGLVQKYPDSAFLVENKPGASGNLGTDIVAKATPDGSVIGISIGGPLAINTLLFSKLPYDPQKDITPVTQLVSQPCALAVNPEVKAENVAGLIALLKQNPGKYNFSSIGNGSQSHLVMAAIAMKAGAQLVHVPYPASPQAVTAIIRNDAQMGCLPAISVTPQAAAGVKILAISTAKRSPFLPGVPTLKESGVDVDADAWNGIIAPGGTPAIIVAQMNKDIVGIIKQPAARDRLAAQLMEVVGSSPEEFRARIQSEIGNWAPVIKAADIKVN